MPLGLHLPREQRWVGGRRKNNSPEKNVLFEGFFRNMEIWRSKGYKKSQMMSLAHLEIFPEIAENASSKAPRLYRNKLDPLRVADCIQIPQSGGALVDKHHHLKDTRQWQGEEATPLLMYACFETRIMGHPSAGQMVESKRKFLKTLKEKEEEKTSKNIPVRNEKNSPVEWRNWSSFPTKKISHLK